MELKKYNHIVGSLRQWEDSKQPYWFTIEWESVEEPSVLKNWTGANRVTGIDKFTDAIVNLQKYPNCGKIHFTAYSGQTGKKVLLQDVMVVYEPNFHYPVQQVMETKKPEPQQQSSEPKTNPINPMDFFGAILGGNGLGDITSGPQMLGALLSIRDERMINQFEKKDLEKELAQLRLDKSLLENKLNEANKSIEELEDENDELLGSLDELTASNQALQKYVPENSPLGLSISALGTSALTGFVKKIVSNNPQVVANLLGTDIGTLNGLFEPSAEPKREIIESPEVSVELSGGDENLTPERKKEIEVINAITNWLKGISTYNLALAQRIINMWATDIETLEMHYKFVTGENKQE